MINVTVKTLDSQNHAFDIEEEMTVKQFKDQISPTIGIPSDQQRLIFRGRVLQDDKKISEYNVANNVIHVVQRPSNQNSTANDEPPPRSNAGLMGDGGMFDGDGGGRNAIIMGAIGLPTFDIEDGLGDEGGTGVRRSGAQVRLMVGNHMLNRASTLLQRLEDDDATVAAAAASASQSSPEASQQQDDLGEILEGDAAMDIDDDSGSFERILSQVVNASTSAALLAAVRQVQPSANGGSSGPQQQSSNNNSSSSGEGNLASQGAAAGGTSESNNGASNTTSSPAQSRRNGRRQPESPRLRELATALQDFLALQDRLNPFLRYIQNELRQNRLYSEQGEAASTQFAYDTISSILHVLSHSLHAFSDIMCDFSIAPETRRLTAVSSILVEQSTVVRAHIPVAVPAGTTAALLAGASGVVTSGPSGNNNNNPISGSSAPANPQSQSGGMSFSIPMATMGGGGQFRFPTGGMSLPFPMGINPSGGTTTTQSGAWRNPNLQTNPPNSNTLPGQTGNPQSLNGLSNNPVTQQQQSEVPSAGTNNIGASIPVFPAGLGNLGALLGMAGGGSVNVNVFAGAGGGGTGFLPANSINLGNFRMGNSGGSNNNVNSGTGAVPSTQNAPPAGQRQGQQNSGSASSGNSASNGTATSNNNTNGGGGGANAAMLQNLLRNEMNRPPFDSILHCHTHHGSDRSSRNRPRPVEFRQFVNLENQHRDSLAVGQSEGEALEVLIDLVRHSRLINILHPMLKDVVLSYLMRGRDPSNDAHVKTCAKGLAKKILPFFEAFLKKVTGKNDMIDISATYLNILIDFIAGLIRISIGTSGDFKTELLYAFTEFQKKLIQAFKLCFPSNPTVGLNFIDYIVDQFLGGMSIVFKNQTRKTLVDYFKELESIVQDSLSSSFIVNKQSVGTVKSEPSSSGNASSNPGSSSSATAASIPEAPVVNAQVKKEPMVSDDVDIDEVLQLPPSMTQSQQSPRTSVTSTGGAIAGSPQSLQNQTDSITSLLRNLPSEWESTVVQDVRRQRDMPDQPSFSPGYNTLFPRKH